MIRALMTVQILHNTINRIKAKITTLSTSRFYIFKIKNIMYYFVEIVAQPFTDIYLLYNNLKIIKHIFFTP